MQGPRHPLHPALVHFPVAFLSAGTLADFFGLAGVDGTARIAWGSIAAGLIAALPALLAGMIDFARLDEALVKRATAHAAFITIALSAYCAAFFARSSGLAPADDPGWVAIGSSIAGLAFLVVGAYRGGELVYTYRAGVSGDETRCARR